MTNLALNIPLDPFVSQRRAPITRRDDTVRAPLGPISRSCRFSAETSATIFEGVCEDLLCEIPDGAVQLTVTSPPYNIGKPYERRVHLDSYLESQERVIREVGRATAIGGSVCWQIGNHVDDGEVFPLDILLYPIFKSVGLKLRNRIIWHYEHGLHASKRFSGRYETILWFTKGDHYIFDLDPLRIPQKYPNKRHYRGPKIGELSGHPLGKNPGDVWIFPNVKSNHVEKTVHPCQFPVELVERLVLAMTQPGQLVFDPYGGVGTTVLAAVLNARRGAMAEVVPEYVEVTHQRLDLAEAGLLRTRPMNRPVYQPN
jgi:adenine-specific DNA-methyltransferase